MGDEYNFFVVIKYRFLQSLSHFVTAFSESGHPFVSYADIFPIREITLYTREPTYFTPTINKEPKKLGLKPSFLW